MHWVCSFLVASSTLDGCPWHGTSWLWLWAATNPLPNPGPPDLSALCSVASAESPLQRSQLSRGPFQGHPGFLDWVRINHIKVLMSWAVCLTPCSISGSLPSAWEGVDGLQALAVCAFQPRVLLWQLLPSLPRHGLAGAGSSWLLPSPA